MKLKRRAVKFFTLNNKNKTKNILYHKKDDNVFQICKSNLKSTGHFNLVTECYSGQNDQTQSYVIFLCDYHIMNHLFEANSSAHKKKASWQQKNYIAIVI